MYVEKTRKKGVLGTFSNFKYLKKLQKKSLFPAGRPAPLLRRCSVPTFAANHQNIIRQLGRPSMDSFSEDDLGIETKRRVRMIHRH